MLGKKRVPEHMIGVRESILPERKGEFRAFVRKGMRHVHLGYFKNPKDAMLAADVAALSLDIDARLNFPDLRNENLVKAECLKLEASSSKYRGVYWNEGTETWTVKVESPGISKVFKGLPDEISAARKYDSYLHKYLGGKNKSRFNFFDELGPRPVRRW